jgi:UDP-N-acetylmuramate dehydrogenase
MHDPLRSALQDLRGAVRTNVPLAPLTHLRIGGPAQWFVEPYAEEDVGRVVRVCRELDVPLRTLGGGSNVVVSDHGVPGVVLSLGSLNRVVRDQNRLTAGAGTSLPTLLRGARELGLAGLEALTGVPAVVGGAVAMNAGTREGETFDRIESITVVAPDGELHVLRRADLSPHYRDGNLGDRIVVGATFALEEDSPKAIFARFEAYLKYRNATQPITERSVGCVFRNPSGDSAGRLIEQAGCKLLRRGGISVSAKHANYFVNDQNGTFADFMALLEDVRSRVEERFGIGLVPEVKVWAE